MKVGIQNNLIDRIAMFAIVLVSLGYILFGSSFAQLRLEFSFLNFPIFIGEILLMFSSLLFLIKSFGGKDVLGRWGWLLGAYFLFILLKAFPGYQAWGPLAFRDAALFYYPFFVVLGYSFWSPELWGDKTRRSLIIVILLIFIMHQFTTFWTCSLIILGIMLAVQAKNFIEKIIFLMGIVIFIPYGTLFNVFLRTVFLSSFITMVFISFVLFFLFCKSQKGRIWGVLIGVLLLGTFIVEFGQTKIGKGFVIKDAKPLVVTLPQELARGKCLYHPVGSAPDKPDTMKEFLRRMSSSYPATRKKPPLEKQVIVVNNEKMVKKEANIKNNPVEAENEIIGNKQSDTLFRFYIWRDMIHEYCQYKPLFGFDFGRPLHSSTMQHYNLSSSEYFDGWVGAHNSFLNMIYRAGIVGLVLVLSFLLIWFNLLSDFYLLKDWVGILLCAILLNWTVSANFFLIFELPYTAIPVWTILGITLKHRMLLKK
jgi:hypothetical protein